jgi:hypothetical protein
MAGELFGAAAGTSPTAGNAVANVSGTSRSAKQPLLPREVASRGGKIEQRLNGLRVDVLQWHGAQAGKIKAEMEKDRAVSAAIMSGSSEPQCLNVPEYCGHSWGSDRAYIRLVVQGRSSGFSY